MVTICTKALIVKAQHFAKECAFVFRVVFKTKHDFFYVPTAAPVINTVLCVVTPRSLVVTKV